MFATRPVLAAAWPSMPQRTAMADCAVLALLLHLLAVLLLGSTPGGSARPGEGVWGAIDVRLAGDGPPPRSAADAAVPTPAYSGPVGTAESRRWGGAVRDRADNAVQPGAARVGVWGPQPADDTGAATATLRQDQAALAETLPLPRLGERIDPLPLPAAAPALPAAPRSLPPATAALPLPRALPRIDSVEPLAPPAAPAPLPSVPAAPRALSSAAAPLSLPAALASVGPVEPMPAPAAPAQLPALPAPPRTLPAAAAPLALPAAALQSVPQVESAAVPTVPAPLPIAPPLPRALPPVAAAALPASPGTLERVAAVPMPSVPAPLPALAAQPRALPATAAAPLAASPGALARVETLPMPAAPAPLPALAGQPRALPAIAGDAGPVRMPALPAGGGVAAAPGPSAPDAGAQAGHDVATAPTAPVAAPRLNLDLPRPRGGAISQLASSGLLPVLPHVAEIKSKLADDIDRAGRADCRTAYSSHGLLAAAPLAVDAVRGDGCRW